MTPDTYTNQELFLDVGEGHQLYIHDWGKKDARLPIVYLHGGPGVGVGDLHKQRFDPTRERVIFFDQRGAGKSTPTGSIQNNTTRDLVEDTHKVVQKLAIQAFIIVGGSWGSTLALTYAIAHPEGITAMVLHGIFMGSQAENDYLNNGGFRTHFPDVWQNYVDQTPVEFRDNPSAYHFQQALEGQEEDAKRSIYAYSEMEQALMSLDDRHTAQDYDAFEPNGMRIELHYLQNSLFIPEGYILENASKLTMPIWLIQGRYDFVCPPTAAYALHQKLPNSQLAWTIAGHGNDRPLYDAVRNILLTVSSSQI
jgi:proline iminopeptidase